MTTQNIEEKILLAKKEVDDFIFNFFESQKHRNDLILMDSMKYSVVNRGKRIRSFIILSCAKHFKISKAVSLVLCLCVEIIHAYSLIHDDLPCMDNSNTRDGILTNHIKYGEANSLLAGNSLLTLVFEILSSPLLTLDSYDKIQIINAIAIAFGHNGVMGGQAFDIMIAKKEIKDLNLKTIFEMQKLKTGEFFAFCSSVCGILSSKYDEIEKQKQFGYLFGKIYQIVDDIKDSDEDGLNSVLNFMSKEDAISLAKTLLKETKESTKISDLKDLADYIVQQL